MRIDPRYVENTPIHYIIPLLSGGEAGTGAGAAQVRSQRL
jgi:hypothetical protein